MLDNRRIWLIGGTSESARLASAIALSHLPCIVTVTTEAARALYVTTPLLQVWVGKLDAVQVEQFLKQQEIAAILDASHPYAVEVSKLAIAAAARYQIPYLRYERPPLIPQSPNLGIQPMPILLDNFDALLAGDYLTAQRVLLTVGYRHLPLFHPWQEKSNLFARILPSLTALQAALEAGFKSDRLIAIRPPISLDLEKAIWQQWQISMIVTKASGTPGGEDIKRTLAAELGVSLVIIDRPAIEYPQQTSDVAIAVKFCRQVFKRAL